jgi:hypothetical protein
MESSKNKSNKLLTKVTLSLLPILILAGLAGGGTFMFIKYKNTSDELRRLKEDPDAATREEVQAVISKVKELAEVPEDEEPTVATVTDIDKIGDQPFFTGAKNGDKVLIYTEAKKAILYRPESGKIIEVAPVTIGNQQGIDQDDGEGEDVEGAAESHISAVLFSGVDTAESISNVSNTLNSNTNNYSFEVTEQATINSYTDTLVVDVTGTRPTEAETIANLLGGTVSSYPENESKVETDIAIFIGTNFNK